MSKDFSILSKLSNLLVPCYLSYFFIIFLVTTEPGGISPFISNFFKNQTEDLSMSVFSKSNLLASQNQSL